MHIKNENINTKNITKCKSKNVDENCKGKTDDKPIWKIIEKKKIHEKETKNSFFKENTRVSPHVPRNGNLVTFLNLILLANDWIKLIIK